MYVVSNQVMTDKSLNCQMLVVSGNRVDAREAAAEKTILPGLPRSTWFNKEFTTCEHVGWAKRNAFRGVVKIFTK
jgi:hypothetical protein